MVLPMTDDNEPDPKTQKSGAELSAEAGIGRGCPFCGRREKTIRDWRFLRLADTNTTQLECLSCGARGPRCITAKNGTDLLEALKLWNERQGEGDYFSNVTAARCNRGSNGRCCRSPSILIGLENPNILPSESTKYSCQRTWGTANFGRATMPPAASIVLVRASKSATSNEQTKAFVPDCGAGAFAGRFSSPPCAPPVSMR
jgi:hypothetical protein